MLLPRRPTHSPRHGVPWAQALLRTPLLVYRTLRWGSWRGGWLPGYLKRPPFDPRCLAPGATIDVMVLVADHFEPARRFGDAAAVESVQSWVAAYEALAAGHRDADGRFPQHTWFYRYDYPNPGCVQALSESAFRGFGEVEFHLHHSHDTEASFAGRLREGLRWFNSFGAMLTTEAQPQQRFGYVAGNWALDNGAGDDALSGCDTEIRALSAAGCYADFTFPCLGSPAQPRTTNRLYYATEDGRPKSYDGGTEMTVGRAPTGDLLIFQGPTAIDWRRGRLDDGALEDFSPPDAERLPAWLSPHIHVAGRPDWVFVKTHTHAMQCRRSFLGPATDALFTAMEKHWNWPPFRLHYVTAREAYNIAKAAENGHSGDPNHFRDYLIPRPANRAAACSSPWRLLAATPDRLHLRVMSRGSVRLNFAGRDLRSLSGRIREVEALWRRGELAELCIRGDGPFEVDPPRCRQALRVGTAADHENLVQSA